MDEQTVNALISAGSGLVGAVIGVAGASLVASREHHRTLKAEREAEARQRARDAALACDHALEELARDLPASHSSNTHDEARSLREIHNRAAVERAVVELPGPWRARVERAMEYLQWADDLADYGYHYSGCWSICRAVGREIHEVIAAFLRNEPEPPAPSQLWSEYGVALGELFEMKDDEHAEENAHFERRRSRWRAEHSLPDGG